MFSPGTAGTVVTLAFGSFFAKIVFDKIYKDRKGTARIALLGDRPVLGPGTAGAVVILIFGKVSFCKNCVHLR